MIYRTSSVVRGIERCLVVVNLPFGSYQSDQRSFAHLPSNYESGGHSIKLEEVEREVKESIKRILNAGIPVMGHLGLTLIYL
jgi:3-methyl-2-oxobutanoate hydroxymethyltransferase